MTDLIAHVNAMLAREFGQAIKCIPIPISPAPPASEQAQDAPQGFAGGVIHSTETQA